MLKTFLYKIPLLRGIAALAVGIALHRHFAADWLFWPSIGTMAICAIGIAAHIRYPRYRNQHWTGIAVIVSMLAFGALYANLRSTSLIADKSACTISGTLTQIVKTDSRTTRFQITADTLRTQTALYFDVDGIVSVADSTFAYQPGDRLRIEARIMPPRAATHSAFNYGEYLQNNHLRFVAYATTVVHTGHTALSAYSILGKCRNFMLATLARCGISGDNLSLLQALFLGDKSALAPELKEAFSNCGTIHILAVSGLHVGIIYLFISAVAGAMLRRKGWAFCACVLSALWFYALLTGLSPSVFRATIMMSCIEISRAAERRASIFNNMAVAFLIIIVADPMSIFSVGLWLSFAAVAGIVALYQPIENLNPFTFPVWRFIYSTVAVTIAAQVATMPITIALFHSFPNYFMLNNAILVPMVAPVIVCALITCCVGCATAWGGTIFGGLTDGMLTFIQDYARMASQWPHSVTDNIAFGVAEAVALGCAVLAFATLINTGYMRHLRATAICIAALATASIISDLISYNTHRIEVYETYGKLNAAINNGGEVTHLLTDTDHNASLQEAADISIAWRASSHRIAELKCGTSITYGNHKLLFASKPDSTATTAVLCTPMLPEAWPAPWPKVILTSNTLYTQLWHGFAVGEPAASVLTEPIIIDH